MTTPTKPVSSAPRTIFGSKLGAIGRVNPPPPPPVITGHHRTRGRHGAARGAAGLDQRGVRHVSYPGHDHEGMLSHIDEAVPDVLTWFDQL
jgi:hypothetical protein